MAETLDTSLATSNIAGPTGTGDFNSDVKSVQQNLQDSAGKQMQQTLFWDYQNNRPPSQLPGRDYGPGYPNLVGAAQNSLNKNKPQTWDDMAKASLDAVRQRQGEAGRNLIMNPGERVSRYDVNKHNAIGYVRGADNEQIHSDLEDTTSRWTIGLQNAFVKAGATMLSTVGYLGKLPFAALSGDFSSASDNWLSKWASNIRENPHNNIYHPEGYDTKNALEKLGTATWWGEQGADMAGFVIGSMLPAAAVSKLGLLTRGGQLIGDALYASKAAQLAGAVEGASAVGTELTGIAKVGYNMAKNQKWIGAMNMFETGLTSAVSEAMFEGADAKKRIYQDLLTKGFNPDEAERIATKNANAVIGLNTVVLFPSSLFEINALLKGGANLKAAAKLIRNGELLKPTIGKYAGKAAIGALEGALVEGVWEENIQNSIQILGDKMSKGEIDTGVASIFSNLIGDSINNFTTPEGQENILGGVVMGVLMGGKSGATQLKDDYKEAQKILPKWQSSYNDHEQLTKDLVTLSKYFKNKDNYVMKQDGQYVLDTDGNVKVNTAKLIEDVKNLGLSVDLSNQLTNAAQRGDKHLEQVAKNQLIGEFVHAHMANGMEERMMNKLEGFANMSDQEKQSLGIITNETDVNGNPMSFNQQINQIKNKVNEYKELFNHIDGFFPEVLHKDKDGEEYGYDVKGIFREAVLNKSILDNLDNLDQRQGILREQMISNFDQNTRNNGVYLQTQLNNKIGTFSTEVDPDAKVKAYQEVNPNSPTSKEFNSIENSRKEYQKALKESNKRYIALTDQKAVVKKIADTLESKEKAQQKIKDKEEIAKQAKDKAKENDKAKEDKAAAEKAVNDLTTQLNNPNLTEEERTKARDAKTEAEKTITEADKKIKDTENKGEVTETNGSGQTLADLIANNSPTNVEDMPATMTAEEAKQEKGDSTARPSDSLPGKDANERAQAAADAIINHFNKMPDGSGEAKVEKFVDIVEKGGPEAALSYYDNLFGSKKEGNTVDFKGQRIKLGARYKGNDDQGTIWKVKGVDNNGNLVMYAASEAGKTTLITDLEQLKQMEALDKDVKPKQEKKNEKVGNYFRIPNANTFLEVYQALMSMGREYLSKMIVNSNPAELKSKLYIVFERESLPDLLAKSKQTLKTDNPNLTQKAGTAFRFKIMMGDDIIGYGTNPNKYIIYDDNGKVVKIDDLDQRLFEKIYDTNQPNAVGLEVFKTNFKKGVKLYMELLTRMDNAGLDSITVSADELAELMDWKINPGEYDYSTDKQFKLSELEHNTIEGQVYVLDLQNIYEPGTGKVVGRTVTPIISDPLKQAAVDKAIQEQLGSVITPDMLKSYGRYVAVVQLPNGQVRFVELSTPVLTEEQGQSLLTKLAERQKESFTNIDQEETAKQNKRVPKTNLFNDDFNDKLSNEVFIAVNDKKGVDIGLSMTPTGILRLDINDYSDPMSPKSTTLYVNEDLSEIKSTKELIAKINEAIDAYNGKGKQLAAAKTQAESPEVAEYTKRIQEDQATLDKIKAEMSTMKGIQSTVNNETTRKIINAYRAIFGLEAYTGPLDGLYKAAKEANEYYSYDLLNKLNGLEISGQYVIKIAEEEIGFRIKQNTEYLNKAKQKANKVNVNTLAEANQVESKDKIDFKLNDKSFKKSLGKNADSDEMLDMQTSVNPGIVKNASLEVSPKDFVSTKKNEAGVITPRTETVTTEVTKQPTGTIEGISTKLTTDLDKAKYLTQIKSHADLDTALEEWINDNLGINAISDVEVIIQKANIYLDNNKPKAPETVAPIESTNPKADIVAEIEAKQQAIKDIKAKGANNTLVDENGSPFLDKVTRNLYAKGLIDKLNKEIAALQAKLPKDNTTAHKIVKSDSTVESRTTLQEFKDFLKKNLPVFISVEDIDTLVNNLTSKGLTLGIFQTNLEIINGVRKVVGGIIGTREENAFKYHEAFHAVFRLLLPESKIKSLLKEAKAEYATVLKSEGRDLQSAIKEFRESSSLYAGLTDSQIEERLYEEYMADKFDEWKTNKSVKTSSNIKSIFRKIADWFKAFATRIGLAKQDMMGLFEDINTGKYKNTSIQVNRFTATQEELERGMTDEQDRPIDGLFPTGAALKLIKIGEETNTDEFGNIVVSPKYLTQSQSNKLVGTVVAVFLRRYQGYRGQINTLVNEIMNDYANLYNSESEVYAERDDYFDIMDELDELKYAYSDADSKAALAENINYSLEQLGFKENEEDGQLEDDTDDTGDRQVGNYAIETSSIGGFGSLSKFLRRYIASTTYNAVDELGQPIPDKFGNLELTPGEPLVEAVDSNVVYNGLLKALANINDQTVFVNRLIEYAKGNEQSAHFIQRFITDTGLSVNEDGIFSIQKNPTLFQMVIKGFNQYRVDYLFSQKDANAKATKIFPSNQRDVAQTQFDLWYNSFTNLYQDVLDKITDAAEKQKFIADRVKLLSHLSNMLQYKKAMTNADLERESEEISIKLQAQYGISLSKNYIKFSIIAGMKGDKTVAQQKYFNAFEALTPITPEDINEISKTLQKENNPFIKTVVEEMDINPDEVAVDDAVELDTANIGRLKKLAENNAVLDESVGSSSFVNAEGKTVYGHQLPTFHLVATTDLNSKEYRKGLRKNSYLKNNWLLNSKAFEAIANTLRIARIDGLRQVTFSRDKNGNLFENRALDVNKRDGIVYGSYSDREFLLSLYDLYLNQKSHTYDDVDKDGNTVKVAFNTSNHLIRVLEASSTGDTIALPIQRLFEKGKLNDAAVNALVNEVVTEYQRIQEAKKEIAAIAKGTKTNGIIQDYHNGKQKGLRFFKLAAAVNTTVTIGNQEINLQKYLQDKANEEKNYKLTEEDLQHISNAVRNYYENQIKDLMDLMVDHNILKGDRTTGYTNILLPEQFENGIRTNYQYDAASSERMGLNDSIVDNIGQVFMNDFLNTLAYNQMILGDAAKGLKDGVDEVKRAKGANGSGASIESRIIAPELGINHAFQEVHIGVIAEPKGTSTFAKVDPVTGEKTTDDVDRADAQMWMTTKGLRYTLFGLSKLTEKQAELLDKIERGETINKEDVFGEQGSLEYDGQTNSIKLVYYDGKKYIKTSGALLQKELTSYQDKDGNWLAIPGRENLHDMRQKMEDFENRNNTVMFMVPKSASKAISEDIMKTDLSDFSDEKAHPLQTKFWRLQLENPSNKIKINDPTQAKQLIDMEQNDSTQVMFRGTKTTVGELRKMYQKASEQRVKNNYIKARNTIFNLDSAFSELQQSINQNKVTPKLAEFQKRAIETLQASGADSQLLGFFSLDEAGNPRYNLNMPITLDKYTQLFLAYFSKGVTNEKVPGHAVALMSDYGMQAMRVVTEVDEAGKPTKWKTIRADQFKANPEKYRFKDINKDVFRVGDAFTSDLQYNVPEYDAQGNVVGYYSEFMLPAHFAELMDIKPGDEIPSEVAKAFGVRIPSQDKHSFISLKMIDFMPANMGSTGIFAKELIKLSGADFDIDKLYMSIAAFYAKKGQLVRYGDTALNDQDKYDEFLHYELNNNKDLKKLVKKKLAASEEYQKLTSDQKLFNASTDGTDIIPGIDITDDYSDAISWDEVTNLSADEINKFIKGKLSIIKKAAVTEALRDMGLPGDLNEYIEQSKKGELNNGVLTNIILDAKIQFLTNDHIRPEIAITPAGVDKLGSMTTDADLKNATNQESNLDTDSILGKTAAFRNNKEGASNIAPAVNSMLVYSLLNKFGIKLREGTEESPVFKITIDGRTFDTYANTVDTDGNRIMDNISTVVSAMTDNAKERLAAKLNMSKASIGVVCNMLAQGVPLKVASAILLQPAIKQYFFATKRFSNNFKSTEDRIINGEQITRAEIGKKLLESLQAQIPEGSFDEKYTITSKDLFDVTRDGVNNPMLQWKVLSDYMKMEDQTKYYSSVSQIIKLSKGLGTTFEYGDAIRDNMDKIGINMTDDEFNKSSIPFDARQIITGRDEKLPYHNITANYVKVFNQINELSKSLFIEKTNTFQRIKDIVFSNMDFSKDEFNIPEEELKMKRNLISYLTFKAYQKLMVDENKSSRLTSLSNKLIYDGLDQDGAYKNITQRLDEARKLAPNNYLLNRFLIKNSTKIRQKGETVTNRNNKDGINKIESNTWAKISNSMAEKLQDSFRELYNDPNTKQYAIDLFNYLVVKDGLQFKSGSFLKLIPNFMFYDVLRGATNANEVMKLDPSMMSQKDLDQKYKSTFNASQTELFNEFANIYLTSVNNSFHIPQITNIVKKNVNKTGVKYSNDLQNQITVDIFADVRMETLKTYEEGGKFIVESVMPKGKLDADEKDRFKNNLAEIKESGFTLEDVTELDENGKSNKRLKVNFPYIIKVPGFGKNSGRYFKLVSLDNKKGSTTETKVSNFITRDHTVAKGTKAVYEEIKLKGARAQTTIGQLFGEVPDADKIFEKKPSKINTPASEETKDPTIMGDQTVEEFNHSLDNIFGVTNDGNSVLTEKDGTLPTTTVEQNTNVDNNTPTDSDTAMSIFYSAVTDNSLDGIQMSEDEIREAKENQKDMGVSDGC